MLLTKSVAFFAGPFRKCSCSHKQFDFPNTMPCVSCCLTLKKCHFGRFKSCLKLGPRKFSSHRLNRCKQPCVSHPNHCVCKAFACAHNIDSTLIISHTSLLVNSFSKIFRKSFAPLFCAPHLQKNSTFFASHILSLQKNISSCASLKKLKTSFTFPRKIKSFFYLPKNHCLFI